MLESPMALAWLSVLDVFTNPATAWVIIPVLIFSIPIIQALTGPLTVHIKSLERERLRKMFERLSMEKLDVIKTAITMGYKQNDLSELDTRLEAVIGSEAMQKLLEGKNISGSGAGRSKPTVIGINIDTGGRKAAAKSDAIDLDELMQNELADGLRQRGRDRDHE